MSSIQLTVSKEPRKATEMMSEELSYATKPKVPSMKLLTVVTDLIPGNY